MGTSDSHTEATVNHDGDSLPPQEEKNQDDKNDQVMEGHQGPADADAKFKPSASFWLIFVSLCLASFLAALDVTIVTTALPTIIRDIGGEGQYVWIANSYVVASTATQPFAGKLSNIYGRRPVTLVAIGLFLFGSGLSGGAVNVGMMIAGRCIQGMGSGGIMMLLDLIVCDLVPLRERAKYIGVQMSTSGVAATLGPLIGGAIVQNISWRWTFYINLPIGGLVFASIALFLNVKHKKEPNWKASLARLDLLGNTIFVASVVSLLLGLVMGGQTFPWSSWRIILPIVLGVVGVAVFLVYQGSKMCKDPTMPLELFSNRTSAIAYALTFLSAMLLQWVSYFLPIYFQGVQESTPTRSGVQILPMNAFLIPFTIVAGIAVSKFGKYRPIHNVSFALIALAYGLFTMFDASTTTAEWVIFQIIAAMGLGFTMNTPLTALQASLPDSYSASATATYAFLRSFAFIWGITIPAIVFNAQVSKNVGRITSDVALQSKLAGGDATGYTSKAFLETLDPATRQQVTSLFADSLQIAWYVGLAFALLGFFLSFGEKEIELRTTLDTEYGLNDKKTEKDKRDGIEETAV
jgi:EmrB/QacA subfamily drug resistance transporter